jgi:hypothetical protein
MNKKAKKSKDCIEDFSEANFVISPDSNYENSDEEPIVDKILQLAKPVKKKLRFDNPNDISFSSVEKEKNNKMIGKKRKKDSPVREEIKLAKKTSQPDTKKIAEKNINKITQNNEILVKSQKTNPNSQRNSINIYSENNLKEPVKKIKEIQEKGELEVSILKYFIIYKKLEKFLFYF